MAPPRKSGRKSQKPVKYDAAPAAAKAGSGSMSPSPASSTSAAPATKGKVKHIKKVKARTIVTPEASSSSQYSSSDEDSTIFMNLPALGTSLCLLKFWRK